MLLSQMSAEIRSALASSKAADNDALSTEADAIHEELCLAKLSRATPRSVSAVDQPAVAHTVKVDAPFQPAANNSRVGFPLRLDPLCYLQRKYGVHTYACRLVNCPMKDKIIKPPSSSKQGNGRSGH